jgi:hypothetical protein
MKNSSAASFVYILLGGVVILMLGGLAGWYFYLHSQGAAINTVNAGRNLGGATPSFGSPTGSTQANQAIAAQSFGTNAYVPSTTASSSAIWEVDAAPVAGMGFVDTVVDEHLYYIERANGYVFSAHPSDRMITRLTDTLTPKIYDAQFANDGSFIERSIDSGGKVTTFLGALATSSASDAATSSAITANNKAGQSSLENVVGVFLDPNIQSIAMDHVSRALFYLVQDPQGGVDGISMQWDGSKKQQIFSSLVGSWSPSALDDGTIVLLESPADGLPGYAYSLKSGSALVPLARGVPGLTLLPKTASPLLLYGSSSGTGLSLTGVASSTPRVISLATIADKCVWLPGNSEIAYCAVPNGAIVKNFLDSWYRGIAHSTDDWWKIDLSLGTTQRIYSPSADNFSLDVEDPTIDASGNYIAFINAIDRSLWVLRVSQ